MVVAGFFFRKKHVETWVCSKDSTPIYLSQTGYLRCDKVENYNACNDATKYAHYDKICNWGWNCGSHGDHSFSKYTKGDKESFIYSMSMALRMITGKGMWLSALILELGNQFKYV